MPWNQALFLVEALLVLASLAFHYRRGKIETAFQRLARHRLADVFSYLLQADTFLPGPEKNAELVDYFRSRHAWLPDADAGVKLSEYPANRTLSNVY